NQGCASYIELHQHPRQDIWHYIEEDVVTENYLVDAQHRRIEANKAHHKRLEFQMLMGVREELKHELVKKGLTLVDYIPYGKNWFPYSVRRIRERKQNILLILRSIFDF
ncbi:MAG: proline dehydrogenase family protein, partial [Euryarchaeota archaeon]|nr:proline dehydrogenase family protein [Euryarchaeota archaeon]